ncbi:MAG: transposase [Candidatus Ozemobacteraceae bacterium]
MKTDVVEKTVSVTNEAKLLSNYKGFLQTDGYIGYETVGEREGIIHLGCWTHSFVENSLTF